MATETKTTAEQIAARYDDDGTCHLSPIRPGETASDELDMEPGTLHIVDACRLAGGRSSWKHGKERWAFPDGSSIIIGEGAWDLGIAGADCFCWRGRLSAHDYRCDWGEA